MKIEIGSNRPENFKTYWEAQYDCFHHFEYACGIPSVLYAISTVKENGLPNLNFNSWSSFAGDGGGFFAIVGGLYKFNHAYNDIMRTGEFVINFLGQKYYDSCVKTFKNDYDSNEFELGGFTEEKAETVSCPRISEAFLNLECQLEKDFDLSGNGRGVVLIGKVKHISMDVKYATELKGDNFGEKYGENGFMFNIHAPKNLMTGEGKNSGVGIMNVIRTNV